MSVASVFARSLSSMYRMLGEDAVHTPIATGIPSLDTKRVIFNKDGSTGLDGMQQTLEPVVRVQVSQFPAGLHRNDTLTINTVTWRVREGALPLNDGNELQAPLATV